MAHSLQTDSIPLGHHSQDTRLSFADAVSIGGRSTAPQAPNVQALTFILHRTQAALRAVVHISQGSYSVQDAPSALSSLADRVLPSLHEIAAAHVGLATVQAL